MTDGHGRVTPAFSGSETELLFGFLDYQRDTFAWKTSGLTQDQLAYRHEPSTLTLAGLMKHLAMVEDWWFTHRFQGLARREPAAGVDFHIDPDWEFRTAVDDDPEELRSLWRESVELSRAATAGRGLDELSVLVSRGGTPFSLRWIVLHMLEEYARHNGHADLIREAIDGETGQ